MRDAVTLWRCLSLTGRIHKMISPIDGKLLKNLVNTMGTDTLAACVTRSSAAVIFTGNIGWGRIFNYLHNICAEKLYKMEILLHVFGNKFSMRMIRYAHGFAFLGFLLHMLSFTSFIITYASLFWGCVEHCCNFFYSWCMHSLHYHIISSALVLKLKYSSWTRWIPWL